jgi:hypothetical protein
MCLPGGLHLQVHAILKFDPEKQGGLNDDLYRPSAQRRRKPERGEGEERFDAAFLRPEIAPDRSFRQANVSAMSSPLVPEMPRLLNRLAAIFDKARRGFFRSMAGHIGIPSSRHHDWRLKPWRQVSCAWERAISTLVLLVFVEYRMRRVSVIAGRFAQNARSQQPLKFILARSTQKCH